MTTIIICLHTFVFVYYVQMQYTTVFNCNIQDHMDFIRASTHLCANLYNVPLTTYNGNALPDNLITDDILRSIVTTIALRWMW